MVSESEEALHQKKRMHVRKMLRLPASMRLKMATISSPVRLIDIGRGGVAFASDIAMEVGDEFVLSFRLPENADSIDIMGRVVYAALLEHVGMYRIGARFAGMTEDTACRIVNFVTSPKLGVVE